jgi:hypothetical protein
MMKKLKVSYQRDSTSKRSILIVIRDGLALLLLVMALLIPVLSLLSLGLAMYVMYNVVLVIQQAAASGAETMRTLLKS